MAGLKDKEFRVVLRYTVDSPASVQVARTHVAKAISFLESEPDVGTFNLLSFLPESLLRYGKITDAEGVEIDFSEYSDEDLETIRLMCEESLARQTKLKTK